MKGEELPLQELFQRLREARLPLGIEEYRLVLRALQSGFGIGDRNSLSDGLASPELTATTIQKATARTKSW